MIFALMLHTREESNVHCRDPRFSNVEKLIEQLDTKKFDDDVNASAK